MRPVIHQITPEHVSQNQEADLQVYGANFNESSAVMVDGHFPRTRPVSSTQLEAHLTSSITGQVGPRDVKVHALDTGELSDSVTLYVDPVGGEVY